LAVIRGIKKVIRRVKVKREASLVISFENYELSSIKTGFFLFFLLFFLLFFFLVKKGLAALPER